MGVMDGMDTKKKGMSQMDHASSWLSAPFPMRGRQALLLVHADTIANQHLQCGSGVGCAVLVAYACRCILLFYLLFYS